MLLYFVLSLNDFCLYILLIFLVLNFSESLTHQNLLLVEVSASAVTLETCLVLFSLDEFVKVCPGRWLLDVPT